MPFVPLVTVIVFKKEKRKRKEQKRRKKLKSETLEALEMFSSVYIFSHYEQHTQSHSEEAVELLLKKLTNLSYTTKLKIRLLVKSPHFTHIPSKHFFQIDRNMPKLGN